MARLSDTPGIARLQFMKRLNERRLFGRQSFNPGRSFFVVTPVVRGLNVVRMIVTPGSAHSSRIPMIRDDVCIVREFLEANSTLPVLLDNLSIQKFPHLGW